MPTAIKNFFDHFTALLKKKRESDKIEATDFNVFDYIQPDELRLSRIIADLLNPKGAHGQQTTFLADFIETMAEKASEPLKNTLIKLKKSISDNPSSISIQTEVTTLTGNRRMDIVLNLGGGKGIVIENKPWANDQPVQLRDYAKDARCRFPDGWVLIYLHGSGKAADEYTLPKKEELKRSGNYLDADYAYFIIQWLNNCLKHSQAEKVSVFLRQLISYIEENFQNTFSQETTNG